MTAGFTKLHGTILDSSVWQEDDATLRVWVYFLAKKDRDGYVAATIPGIAGACHKSIEVVEEAIAKFEAPDPYSRTPDYEGRRIERVEGGWLVLNHRFYRDAQSPQQRAVAERVRKHRAAKRQRETDEPPDPDSSPPHNEGCYVTRGNGGKRSAEPLSPPDPLLPRADAEAEAEADPGTSKASSDRKISPLDDQATAKRSRGGGGDPVEWIWEWFEQECIRAGLGRKHRRLSKVRRRKIDALIRHIRETLGCDLKAALASQRTHLLYRIAEARGGRGETRDRLRSDTPWRLGDSNHTCWWDWWFVNVADAPARGNRVTGPTITSPADALAHEAETGSLPSGWFRDADGLRAPNGEHFQIGDVAE